MPCVGLLLLTGALPFPGCAPHTPIRRTAFIPNPYVPARTGRPLRRGEMRATFEVSSLRLGGPNTYDQASLLVSQVGDPGLLIPRFHLGASFYSGIVAGLELGAHFRFALHDWASANTVGVLPFPSFQRRHLFWGGVGLRYNFKLPHRMSISLLGELNIVGISQATYVCKNGPCDAGYTIADPTGTGTQPNNTYLFDHVRTSNFFFPALFAQFTFAVIPNWLHLYATFGAERNVKNVGFDADANSQKDEKLSSMWVGVIGAGIEFNYKLLVITATFAYPIETVRAVNFGFLLNFQVGASFNAF